MDASGRRGRNVAVVLFTVFVYWAVNVWPGWQAVPFLDQSMQDVLGFVNASLIVSGVVSVVNIVANRSAVSAVGEIVTSVVGLVVATRIWVVFPFDFGGSVFNWGMGARILLILAYAGYVISIMVQIAALVRLAGGPASGMSHRRQRNRQSSRAPANTPRSNQ